MAYTNSPLVDYTLLSPFHSGLRNHTIDTVSIHCVVGQCSVESLGRIFQTKQASSNYGIGFDGKIGMYVEEKNRSWCTSSVSNDNRAVTIEVASDDFDPYRVNSAAYNALIKLLTDICKRNNIKELKWRGDKSLIGQIDKQNMTVHRWFAAKACPGDYLYNKHGEIAAAVNKKLGTAPTSAPTSSVKIVFHVQIGVFASKKSADNYIAEAKSKGFTGFVTRDHNNLYHVQIGAFSSRKNADSYLSEAKNKGFNGFVVTENVKSPHRSIKVGDKVYINRGAKTYDGGNLSSFVYDRINLVAELKGNRAVVTYGGITVAAVNVNDLILA